MIILKDDLERFIPSAIEPTGFAFEKLSDAIQLATRSTIDYFVGRETETQIPEGDPVIDLIKKAACLKAYHDTIPSLDLVLTANGFGIVNGQNVAPASKERIERLIESVFVEYQRTVDNLVCTLYEHETLGEQWRTEMSQKVIKHLLWRTDDYQMATGKFNATRADLIRDYPTLALADRVVANYISGDYLKELLEKVRSNTLDEKDNLVVIVLHEVYGLAITKQPYKHVLHDVVNMLDAEIEHFATYKNSKEYQVRNAKGYENKKDDATFFFG